MTATYRYLSLGAGVQRGQFFLHRQRVPLDRTALRPRPPADDTDDGDVPGCGPWTCPHPADAALDSADVREVA